MKILILIQYVFGSHYQDPNTVFGIIFNKKYSDYALGLGRNDEVTPNTKILNLIKVEKRNLNQVSFLIYKGSYGNLVLKDQNRKYRSSLKNNTIQMTSESHDNSLIFIQKINPDDNYSFEITAHGKCLGAYFTTEKHNSYLNLEQCTSTEHQIWEIVPKSLILEKYKIPHPSIQNAKKYFKNMLDKLNKKSLIDNLIKSWE